MIYGKDLTFKELVALINHPTSLLTPLPRINWGERYPTGAHVVNGKIYATWNSEPTAPATYWVEVSIPEDMYG